MSKLISKTNASSLFANPKAIKEPAFLCSVKTRKEVKVTLTLFDVGANADGLRVKDNMGKTVTLPWKAIRHQIKGKQGRDLDAHQKTPSLRLTLPLGLVLFLNLPLEDHYYKVA